MERLRCIVERITYQNEQNGYSVIKCKAKDYSDLVMEASLSAWYLIRSEYSGMDRDEDFEIHGEDSFRANCKRYGLSILTLDYDPHGAEQLKRSLSDLVEHWYLFPLNISEGHERYFALDSAMALKGLHYRLPLLRTFHVSAQLHGQYGCKQYVFTETMREA